MALTDKANKYIDEKPWIIAKKKAKRLNYKQFAQWVSSFPRINVLLKTGSSKLAERAEAFYKAN